MRKLNEGLNHMDMVDQVTPTLGIDEFQSRIGEDSEIIVLNFTVSEQEVGNDLVDWLERGYDWIIDAEISPGEVLDRKWYVFAELNRRSSAPRRIMEVLDDLYTLTGIKGSEWTLHIDGKKYPATIEAIEEHIPTTEVEYKQRNEGELNEWRQIAGLKTVQTGTSDSEILEWQRQAGIK